MCGLSSGVKMRLCVPKTTILLKLVIPLLLIIAFALRAALQVKFEEEEAARSHTTTKATAPVLNEHRFGVGHSRHLPGQHHRRRQNRRREQKTSHHRKYLLKTPIPENKPQGELQVKDETIEALTSKEIVPGWDEAGVLYIPAKLRPAKVLQMHLRKAGTSNDSSMAKNDPSSMGEIGHRTTRKSSLESFQGMKNHREEKQQRQNQNQQLEVKASGVWENQRPKEQKVQEQHLVEKQQAMARGSDRVAARADWVRSQVTASRETQKPASKGLRLVQEPGPQIHSPVQKAGQTVFRQMQGPRPLAPKQIQQPGLDQTHIIELRPTASKQVRKSTPIISNWVQKAPSPPVQQPMQKASSTNSPPVEKPLEKLEPVAESLMVLEGNYSGQIIVVEEHHEVLQYWLQDWSIPKSGMTLVHVDAHSDEAPPDMTPNFPWFKGPATQQQLRALMQSNDKFIVAAIASGLISRVVSVWPSWDANSHEVEYEKSIIEVGWYKPQDIHKSSEICVCGQKDDVLIGKECYSPNSPAEKQKSTAQNSKTTTSSTNPGKPNGNEDDDEEPEFIYDITRSQCNIMARCVLESVRDTTAVQKLQTGQWVAPNEPIILNIDEDFFGVEAAKTRFEKVGIKWETVTELDSLIDQIFCVSSVVGEQAVDRYLTDVIRIILLSRARTRKQLVREAMSTLLQVSQSGKELCRQDITSRTKNALNVVKVMREVMVRLIDFNDRQLRLLLKVGFCFDESPVTDFSQNSKDKQHPGFGVCHGSTEPSNTFITHHIPTSSEIDSNISLLKKLFASLPQPRQVTIGRSFRDGFVPKEYFKAIEKGILSSIMTSFPNYKRVWYDSNLLGGPRGWLDRHGPDLDSYVSTA